MNTTHSVVFVWGTSRGRDTYGYTTCTRRVDGKRLGSVNGGGYDLKGAAFGEAITKLAGARLFKLASERAHRYATKTADGHYVDHRENPTKSGLYGLSATTDESGKVISAYVDGACGFDSVRRVAEALGYKLSLVDSTSTREAYSMEGGAS